MRTLRAGVVWAVVVATAWVVPAAATPPGTNGRIAFTSLRDGNFEIYVMNADGSAETRLTTETAHDYDPSWSPDGSKIAFTSEREGDANVYVMDPDGTDVVQLTDDPATDNDPTWSPDGSKILFTTQRDGDFELFVMYPDGTDERRRTTRRSTSKPSGHPTVSGSRSRRRGARISRSPRSGLTGRTSDSSPMTRRRTGRRRGRPTVFPSPSSPTGRSRTGRSCSRWTPPGKTKRPWW